MRQKKNNKEEVCELFCFNKELVAELREKVNNVNGLSETFKVLSDDTRLKIVYALLGKELCSCDIANTVRLSLPAVSHHLRILRNLKLVKYRKESRMVFYSLDDNHISNMIKEGISHLKENRSI